jgi:uncharacterized membrane protein YqjE
MTSRRALLRHLWSMVQTRAEAATVVVALQRAALTEALVMFGVAVVAGLSSVTALIVLIAVAAPEAWRGIALLVVTLALVGAAVYGVVAGRRKLTRDRALVADLASGLKLDLAMMNLALRDPDTEDEKKLAARDQAREKVRDAAAAKAATPSVAEGGEQPSAEGPSGSAAEAAMRAASTEREMPPAPPLDTAGAPEAAAPAAAAPTEPGLEARTQESRSGRAA